MKKILLSQNQVALIDDEDYGLIVRHTWAAHRQRNTFYATTNARLPEGQKTMLYMHRLILSPPDGLVTDHIDGDGLNNCRSNLRACTRGQNAGKQKPQAGRSSRFKGVSWHKSRQKWEAYITADGRCTKLGYFLDEREAARAYNGAAIRLHGAFAYLNSI